MHAVPPASTSFCGFSHRQVGAESGKVAVEGALGSATTQQFQH